MCLHMFTFCGLVYGIVYETPLIHLRYQVKCCRIKLHFSSCEAYKFIRVKKKKLLDSFVAPKR